MDKNTGGQAFPAEFTKQHGMTLRDYFAAKAMQGLQANTTDECMGMDHYDIAKYSYRMADAMLAERDK